MEISTDQVEATRRRESGGPEEVAPRDHSRVTNSNLDQLVQQFQVVLDDAIKQVKELQEQEDWSNPSYAELVSAKLGLEGRLRELTPQLHHI